MAETIVISVATIVLLFSVSSMTVFLTAAFSRNSWALH